MYNNWSCVRKRNYRVGITVPFYMFVFFDIGKTVKGNICYLSSFIKTFEYQLVWTSVFVTIEKYSFMDICITIIFQERKTKIQGLNPLNQNK